MITITKNTKSQDIEYKLEVIKDNNIIYDKTVSIGKQGIEDTQRDELAKLQLMRELLNDGYVEVIKELVDLIPVYEE